MTISTSQQSPVHDSWQNKQPYLDRPENKNKYLMWVHKPQQNNLLADIALRIILVI